MEIALTVACDPHAIKSLRDDETVAAALFADPPTAPFETGGNTWGVERSTLRAYRGIDQPGQRINDWAAGVAAEWRTNGIPGVGAGPAAAAAAFEAMHAKLADQVATVLEAPELPVALRYKPVDLFMIRMALDPTLELAARDHLRRHLHPALDRYALGDVADPENPRGLANLIPGFAFQGMSMGAVRTAAHYHALQSIVRQVTQAIGLVPFNFEVWCWPDGRRETFGLPLVA